MPHVTYKEPKETQIAYVIRVIREQALSEIREEIMNLKPDAISVAPEHQTGYHDGHWAARKAILDIVARAFVRE